MSASHRLTKLRDTTRTEGEALVLLDFAENYSFVCQDAAQSFHWNNLQATLHPVCIYYKSDGNIAHKFMCVICDIIIHDKHGVYTIQHLIIPKIKFPISRQYTTLVTVLATSTRTRPTLKTWCITIDILVSMLCGTSLPLPMASPM